MKILLLGEYSNVHATLAEAFKRLGHDVLVVSNGDFWKNYPRDISLVRRPGTWGGVAYMAKLAATLPRLRGFDVVQIINPMFLELKAARIEPVFRFLKKHNRKIFLGAFGMDYYWVHVNDTLRPMRYSDFNIGDTRRTNADAEKERKDWVGTDKQRLNETVARECNGIIAGLYEYWACYQPLFPEKTRFIPFPIKPGEGQKGGTASDLKKKVRIFIGVNRERSAYKGTDIMLKAVERVAREYPDKMELVKAESVPFNIYGQMMNGSDAILDQLYSYTPSMNALLAMSKGIINIGGGEPENYEILNETQLRPIINVLPDEESVYRQLVELVTHPEMIPRLKSESMEYVRRHHDYLKVARQYLEFYGL